MSRNWHAGKPKKKPGYDPESITQDLLDAAVEVYSRKDSAGQHGEHLSLRKIAEELEAQGCGKINPAKVKKLLITAHAYSTPITVQIGGAKAGGKKDRADYDSHRTVQSGGQ